MRRFRVGPRGSLLLLAALTGCRAPLVEVAPKAPLSLGDAIARDATNLLDLLTPGAVGMLVIWAVLTLGAIRGSQAIVEVLWRTGFDARRRLGTYVAVVQVALVALLIYGLVARIVGAAPVLGSLLLCVMVPTLMVIGAPGLQNLIAGISILLARQLREGDHLRIGGHRGIVRSCGLTHVELAGQDGSTVLLPARLISGEAVVVDHVHNSVAVSATVDVGREAVPARLDMLRRTAWLSPYRSPSSAVDVALEAEGAAKVVIQVAPRAKREASAHLMSSLEECMREANQLGLDHALTQAESWFPPPGAERKRE